jgi:predicted glutamine amidotransferase
VSVDFAEHTNATDLVAVVVSAPLTTNEHWTAFAPGELKVFECGVSGSAQAVMCCFATQVALNC